MKKWLLIAAVALVGTGCSSTEPVMTTYMLPMSTTANTAHNVSNKSLLIVRPVEVAAHLAGTGLVYQTSPTEIVEAQQNLWGEALGKQLTRRITQDLRQKQTKFWPTQLTPTLSTAGVPRLQIRINQFNGVYTGVAEVAGEWLLINGNGDLQTVHPFTFRVPLAKDGYPAQVEALSKGVDELTTQLAQSIK
ncbi:PqiC family protein [Photobacterium leiognathi]|uniref:PqiC family protein n=1 Tax=Photobacterium leiognathi TaxID=553611 RepID=UPI002982B40B|nr:ABC-type transport auxiliary lipoprotein family protein [Photobacterium leiognathi]